MTRLAMLGFMITACTLSACADKEAFETRIKIASERSVVVTWVLGDEGLVKAQQIASEHCAQYGLIAQYVPPADNDTIDAVFNCVS